MPIKTPKIKFISAIILTGLMAFAVLLYLPWWTIAFCSFIVGVVCKQKPLHSFVAAFISLFLLWSIHVSILDFKNDHLLSGKIAKTLKLGDSSFILIIISGLIAGLVGGAAAVTAGFIDKTLTEFPIKRNAVIKS